MHVSCAEVGSDEHNSNMAIDLIESNLKPPHGVRWEQWKHWQNEAMTTGR